MPRQQTQATTHDQSNIPPDLIAEALAVYTQDKGEHDRTGMTIARHQQQYERQGVAAERIRQMFREAKLSGSERQQLYADELRYRRAVSLWDADTEEDFDRAMQKASTVEAADGDGAERLVAARSYNDGFNSAARADGTMDDNPNEPGTLPHAQWAKGCLDGLAHKQKMTGSVMVEKTAPAAARKQTGSRAAPVKEKKPRAKKADVKAALDKASQNGTGHQPVESESLLGLTPGEMPA